MLSLVIAYPTIDPNIVQFGNFSIRWYGLMYVIGFLLAWVIIRYLINKYHKAALSNEDVGDLIFNLTLGVILGGRIGYILFYNLSYYVGNPLKIFAVWEGGMSFHGGLMGVVIATVLFARKKKVKILDLGDLMAVPTGLGLMFGRFGNFINGELIGRHTDLPWGFLYPSEVVPRHPSQLYAAGKDLIIFIVLWQVYKKSQKTGTTTAVFLILYGILRIMVGFFREPDVQIGFIGPFTLGQILSAPLIIIGLAMLYNIKRGKKA
jgi:phosphatidylglycerol:prolipoprotein diacylglycerol transferase